MFNKMIHKSLLSIVFALLFALTKMIAAGRMVGGGLNIRTAVAPAASMQRLSYVNMGPILARTAGYGGNAKQAAGLVPIAIQTRHNIEYKEVPSSGLIHAANVEVAARSIPINIVFRSASSSLNVLQQHQGAMGDTQESRSEDEPHRLVHTVTRPVIQEIHEVISPFRKITQEVEPVKEEIQTVVARNAQLLRSPPQTPPSQQQQQSKAVQLQATVLAPPISTFDALDLNDVTLSKTVYGNGIMAAAASNNNPLGTDGKSVSSANFDKSLSQSVALVLESSGKNAAASSSNSNNSF